MSRKPSHYAFTDKKYDFSGMEISMPKHMKGKYPWWNAEIKKMVGGKAHQLELITPKTRCGGIKTTLKEGTDVPKSYYISMDVCDRNNVKDMSVSEINFVKYLDAVGKLVWDYLVSISTNKEVMSKLGPLVKSTIHEAIEMNDPWYAIKPIMMPGCSLDPDTAHSEVKRYIDDPDKPKRVTFKLWTGTDKENGGLKNYTTIRGPKSPDKSVSSPEPWMIAEKPGMVKCRVSVDSVYLGGHGNKYTWIASVRFRIHEMNYTEVVKAPVLNLLGDNDDELPEEGANAPKPPTFDDSSSDDGSDGEVYNPTVLKVNQETEVEPDDSSEEATELEREPEPEKPKKKRTKKKRNRD